MVLPLELILEMVVAIAAFVSLGAIPVARQMLLQRRYPGSSAPGVGTLIAYVSPPGFFGIAVSDPPVQLQYSPISVWDQPKATPTPTTRPHPSISQAPSANPSHSTPASTSRPQPAMTLARAISDLTERPLARKVKQWWSTSRIVQILHFVFVFFLPRAGLAALLLSVAYNLLDGAARQDR